MLLVIAAMTVAEVFTPSFDSKIGRRRTSCQGRGGGNFAGVFEELFFADLFMDYAPKLRRPRLSPGQLFMPRPFRQTGELLS